MKPKGPIVNFGCGLSAPKTWRNFDASPSLRLQRLPLFGSLIGILRSGVKFPANVEYGDIRKGLPLADSSCELIYCSHVLEHLSRNDCRRALKQTYSLLRPGGTFRLVLPDLETAVKEYKRGGPAAAERLLEATGLGTEERAQGLRSVVEAIFGNSQHLWAWNFAAIKKALNEVGFRKIRRAAAKFQDP